VAGDDDNPNGPGETALVETDGVAPVAVPDSADPQVAEALQLLRKYQRRQRGWLGHFRSYLAVNVGLAVINIVTMWGAGYFHPWFLYPAAGWGMALGIHGMSHRGWLKESDRPLGRAEAIVGAARDESLALLPAAGHALPPRTALPAGEEPAALPPAKGDETWQVLYRECERAAASAKRSLAEAGADEELTRGVVSKLDSGLATVRDVRSGGEAIRRAVDEVGPGGRAALDAELDKLDDKIAGARDDRTKAIYAANRKLLEARRDKLGALEAEEERMRATVDGFRLAAENVRLDAARLGVGQLSGLLDPLTSSLDRLNEEVEIVRQVEAELERLVH